jgi:hypothetical protein
MRSIHSNIFLSATTDSPVLINPSCSLEPYVSTGFHVGGNSSDENWIIVFQFGGTKTSGEFNNE